MSIPSDFPRTPSNSFLLQVQTAGHWIHSRVNALRQATQRRRVLRRLQELRERDPRLFEETGIDPINLPPPRQTGVPLFAQSVVAGYLFGDHV